MFVHTQLLFELKLVTRNLDQSLMALTHVKGSRTEERSDKDASVCS
jgi:hypothetical protein